MLKRSRFKEQNKPGSMQGSRAAVTVEEGNQLVILCVNTRLLPNHPSIERIMKRGVRNKRNEVKDH